MSCHMLSPYTSLMIQGTANTALWTCIRGTSWLTGKSPPSVGQSIDVHGRSSQNPLKVSHALFEGAHAPQAHASVPDIGCVGRLQGNGLLQVSKGFLVLSKILQYQAPACTACTSIRTSDNSARNRGCGNSWACRCYEQHCSRAERLYQHRQYRAGGVAAALQVHAIICVNSCCTTGAACSHNADAVFRFV